jgi:hypothetical protein
MLSVREAAMRLGMAAPSLRRLIAQRIVPIIQLGGPNHAIRIREDTIERLTGARPKAAA